MSFKAPAKIPGIYRASKPSLATCRIEPQKGGFPPGMRLRVRLSRTKRFDAKV
jgi:hypothetical protein